MAAAQTVTIEVKQLDISRGLPSSPSRCPVARAARRAIGPRRFISVGAFHLYLGGRRYSLPAAARRFIVNFDLGGGGKPFSFKIKLAGL